jgi:two-component system cell cycle response regulator CtrA
MRIALVSNNKNALSALEGLVGRQEMEATRIDLGAGTTDTVRAGEFDAVVLQHDRPDVMRDMVTRFRRGGVEAPLIVISDQANVDMRVLLLRLGADDCLSVPYNDAELVARIRAVIRRVRLKARAPVAFGQLAIDLDGKSVSANGRTVGLTVKEYDIFELLYRNRGTVLTKAVLIGRLYKGVDEPQPKIIDVFVCKLRRKLTTATGGIDYIKTVWGMGYTCQNASEARAA